MRKKKISKNLEVAKYLPPLHHSVPSREFDIRDSEVMKWLVSRTDILNYVWNNIKNSGAVVYDPKTGKWQGINYGPNDN